MRVLYIINTGLIGGLQRHVLCLMESLKGIADTAVVINTEIEPQVVDLFADNGMKLYRLHGKSGHDLRIVLRLHKILQDFKPDIVHAHGLPLYGLFYFCLFRRSIPIIHSLHTPPTMPTLTTWLPWKLLEMRIAYWLPVSSETWVRFLKWHPKVKGEIFFNPLRLRHENHSRLDVEGWRGEGPVVGMVGRNDDQKDWPSFHKVEAIVKSRRPEITFFNAGENAICNGREMIGRMDLFIMTSKHEQLPTTVLECFECGTPICGFLPDGGTKDILHFSNGPVRDAFISNRDCSRLANLVEILLDNPSKRQAIVRDGWQILVNHFDAEKNCHGQLMDVYKRFVK